MHTAGGELAFDPVFIEKIGPYRFQVRYRGRRVEVAMDHERVTYRLIRGDPIEVTHGRERFRLKSTTEFARQAS